MQLFEYSSCYIQLVVRYGHLLYVTTQGGPWDNDQPTIVVFILRIYAILNRKYWVLFVLGPLFLARIGLDIVSFYKYFHQIRVILRFYSGLS